MKKTFSILLAVMFLLSGMHLSLATHLCGGEVAAVKWSFSHQLGGCGMKADHEALSTERTIGQACCQDIISIYSVDGQYQFSSLQMKASTIHLLQIFGIPVRIGIAFHSSFAFFNTIVHPPGQLLTSAVDLTDIGVFRI
jgi:hypothetical protein